MIRVFGTVAMTTLVIGLAALLVSFWMVNPDQVWEITRYGNAIANNVAFRRAGMMHGFSYLGGLFGLITGSWEIYHRYRSDRSRRKQTRPIN